MPGMPTDQQQDDMHNRICSISHSCKRRNQKFLVPPTHNDDCATFKKLFSLFACSFWLLCFASMVWRMRIGLLHNAAMLATSCWAACWRDDLSLTMPAVAQLLLNSFSGNWSGQWSRLQSVVATSFHRGFVLLFTFILKNSQNNLTKVRPADL